MPDYEPLAKLAHDGGPRSSPGSLKRALETNPELLDICIDKGWFGEIVAQIAKERTSEG